MLPIKVKDFSEIYIGRGGVEKGEKLEGRYFLNLKDGKEKAIPFVSQLNLGVPKLKTSECFGTYLFEPLLHPVQIFVHLGHKNQCLVKQKKSTKSHLFFNFQIILSA